MGNEDKLAGIGLAPSRPKNPDVKKVLQDRAKQLRQLSADLEDLGDALGFRPLTENQSDLLATLVSVGLEEFPLKRIVRF
jgi:hypothetical protein